jgi:hypothetical protein
MYHHLPRKWESRCVFFITVLFLVFVVSRGLSRPQEWSAEDLLTSSDQPQKKCAPRGSLVRGATTLEKKNIIILTRPLEKKGFVVVVVVMMTVMMIRCRPIGDHPYRSRLFWSDQRSWYNCADRRRWQSPLPPSPETTLTIPTPAAALMRPIIMFRLLMVVTSSGGAAAVVVPTLFLVEVKMPSPMLLSARRRGDGRDDDDDRGCGSGCNSNKAMRPSAAHQ